MVTVIPGMGIWSINDVMVNKKYEVVIWKSYSSKITKSSMLMSSLDTQMM